MFVMFTIYELSIVVGYKITDYTWPLLASLKNFVVDISPQPYLTDVPMITDFAIWMVNSGNALLNYLPIFFILFALIAILEDTGYMPRMAFILDRVFRKFGLHGQSTLPLVLGGAFVGGCAVPGVMATKGIADDRARMATILSVPLMNCLAKVPFYTLLLGAFFATQMSLMMFYISTVTIMMALIYAKALTSTVLQTRETTPFVMELPPYHLPTFKGVLLRASERVWQYITKVVTIVLAIAIILFAMLEFPGVSSVKQKEFDLATEQILIKFHKNVNGNIYYNYVDTKDEVAILLNYYDEYKAKKMAAGENSEAIDQQFIQKNKDLYKFIRPAGDKNATKINRALRDLSKKRNGILREVKKEKIENSLLGIAGKSIEPFTQYAGFDWKINVSFLSSFAARESAVATLGGIYENNQADTTKRAEETMAENSGYTPLHATAMIIFMLLTPPCIATMIVVKMQTGSYKWMMFAIFFPITLGIIVAVSVFQMGIFYNLNGVEVMGIFYSIVLAITLVLGFFPEKRINWGGGFRPKSDGLYSVYKRKNL
jgi:ferrous iron transport protein B